MKGCLRTRSKPEVRVCSRIMNKTEQDYFLIWIKTQNRKNNSCLCLVAHCLEIIITVMIRKGY